MSKREVHHSVLFLCGYNEMFSISDITPACTGLKFGPLVIPNKSSQKILGSYSIALGTQYQRYSITQSKQ